VFVQQLHIEIHPKQTPAVVAKVGNKVVWSGIDRDWKPWKTALGDVDGDKSTDFLIGLFKHTRHRPFRIHTIFVYTYEGGRVRPKWRGSRLARDFIDFTLHRSRGKDKLFTLDRLLGGRYTLSCYAWSGFGFRKEWERGAWRKARLQEGGANSITVVTEAGPVKISTEG
jgi:hypothetical protein